MDDHAWRFREKVIPSASRSLAMCRPNCPFATSLFGAITGSAAGATIGAISGWLLYAAYASSGGPDPESLVALVFGTLGMGIGGSGGAVGGMIEGWGLADGKPTSEVSAAKWGAGLGALWGLQPILWLAFKTDVSTAMTSSLGILLAVVTLGAVAGSLGGLTARKMVRAFGSMRAPAIPVSKRL